MPGLKRVAERFGSEKRGRAVGFCTSAFVFGASFPLIILVGFTYSFFVVAESPVQSAGLTELVAYYYLGAALGLQTLFGFLAASVSPTLFGYVLDITNPVASVRNVATVSIWGWAFMALVVGAIMGPWP